MKENVSQTNHHVHDVAQKLFIANELIEVPWRCSATEQKLAVYILGNCRKEKIPKQEILRLVNYHYHVLHATMQALTQPLICYQDKYIPLLESYSISSSTSYIHVSVAQEILAIMQSSHSYTAIESDMLYRLRSKYSLKIYMLLARYCDTGWRRDHIEDFRRKLNTQYKWKDIRKYVLKTAIEEITTHAKMTIQYERQNEYIHFSFTCKHEITKIAQTENKEQEKKDTIDTLFEQEFIAYLQRDCNIKNPVALWKKMSAEDVHTNIRMVLRRAVEDVPHIKPTLTKIAKKDLKLAFLFVIRPDQREKILAKLEGEQI